MKKRYLRGLIEIDLTIARKFALEECLKSIDLQFEVAKKDLIKKLKEEISG